MTKIKNLTREGTRIKSLTLENFGPFQGKHKITFAPGDIRNLTVVIGSSHYGIGPPSHYGGDGVMGEDKRFELTSMISYGIRHALGQTTTKDLYGMDNFKDWPKIFPEHYYKNAKASVEIVGETPVINEENEINFETRSSLSSKAFGHTAQYDTIIHNYLKNSKLSNDFTLTYNKHSDMRYGENPHQNAAAFKIPGDKSNGILNAKIHQGKKLSYNNIMDADAALSCLKEFKSTACVIVKHANPCGVALGTNMLDVYKRAFAADSISAFGGIIAINQPCDDILAEEISKVFVEIVLAPAFTKKSLDIFSKKKNLRVLEVGNIEKRDQLLEVRNIVGGVIVQETDTSVLSRSELKTVTELEPSKEEINTMLFGWKVLKHIKSNGILIVKENTTVGVGAGQVSRVDSVDIAMKKSGKEIKNSILCSDAFFPFRDSIDKIAGSGIKAVLQPGGSVRDDEVISACNEHGIAMVFTGQRCFKH